MELKSKYNHLEVEKDKYKFWLDGGFFASGDLSKKPYTIVIPPPNVTGKLHLGHAWDTTLQDIIIRRKRMQGFDALWLPGMDHAGIATQAKIDAKLKSQGISRYDIGREKFLEVAWQWKKEYADHIREQWASVGLSLDYNKEKFTLDEGLQKAVKEVFIKLYDKGLIYRGERIINWDPQAQTALSNIEIEHKEVEGAFYHFIYPLKDEEGGIEIATTRPETMFGDVAVMVHPDDDRYTAYVGKEVLIPGTNRAIPIITDKYVDMEFGSGAVKVTPAHDPNDFMIGKKYNLEMPLCMNEDGTMNHLAHKYENMDRFACREQLVTDLKELGLCPKVKKHVHQVGHSERTDVVVEPRLSKQWFVKMKPLAENALNKNTVNFVPNRFEKIFNHWMEGIEDWCISRQLWWGHRIPVWYKGDEIYCGLEQPCGDGWVQDEDVLDTWFSSALWPFSTLGWPEITEDLKRYYPTDVLVTGYDIIFFWVSRMIFQAIEFTNESPFKDVLIHGLIRDSKGRKMSKSLGNGVDPIQVVHDYGADSLRYFLTTNSAPGQDLRYEQEKVESSWNFINKIWNISRYVLMNLGDLSYEYIKIDKANLNLADKWILSRLYETIKDVDANYEKYEFGEAARSLYNFTWNDFASWYVEMSKLTLNGANEEASQQTKYVLAHTLESIMKLLHPFMPFVTEEIYQKIPHKEKSITISDWPTLNEELNFKHSILDMALITEVIKKVRNVRSEYNVAPSKKIDILIKTENTEALTLLKDNNIFLNKFLNPSRYIIGHNTICEEEAISIILNDCIIYLPLGSLVNIEEEIIKLKKELDKLTNEIKRCENMLSNPNFVNKAPAQKVESEKEKLEKYKENHKLVKERLENYKN